MKLIKSSAEYIPQKEGLEGIYRQIEIAARTCYKSESQGKPAEEFVDMLIKRGHTAMLEHGTVYLNLKNFTWSGDKFDKFMDDGPYTKTHICSTILTRPAYIPHDAFVTTNLRCVYEHNHPYHLFTDNNMDNFMKYLCEPTEYHPKRYTFRLITSIGIVRELLRHRVFSFANESTRYCNYSKDKFNNEITYIIPSWYQGNTPENILEKITDSGHLAYYQTLEQCERTYYAMLFSGLQPQQAREVLPLCTKSELIMTGFASDWRHFFDLRLFGKTGEPHPDMKVLAEQIKEECIKNNIWDDIINQKSKFK
jgi:thymidylate synthase (FAD)